MGRLTMLRGHPPHHKPDQGVGDRPRSEQPGSAPVGGRSPDAAVPAPVGAGTVGRAGGDGSEQRQTCSKMAPGSVPVGGTSSFGLSLIDSEVPWPMKKLNGKLQLLTLSIWPSALT